MYICLAVENLFSCLTPFSETYELRGYISIDINRMAWIACVACWVAWIKASVEKQSLVVDDQSTAYVAALCITWIREPHTSVWVKNGIRTAGRTRRFFLALVVSVTYQPWHLYTFHLCGCWMRRLDYRSVRTGKRVFRNCQSSNVSEDRPWRSRIAQSV